MTSLVLLAALALGNPPPAPMPDFHEVISVSFPSTPKFEEIEPDKLGNFIRLLEAFRFVVTWKDAKGQTRIDVWDIPAGFLSDGGSVPRIGWTLSGITPMEPRAIKAFLAHDWLYTLGHFGKVRKDYSDQVLKLGLQVNWFQRQMIYRGVQIGGGSHFNGLGTPQERGWLQAAGITV